MVKTDSSDHSEPLVPSASFCVVLFRGFSLRFTIQCQCSLSSYTTEILASRRLPSTLLTTINLHERQLLLPDDYVIAPTPEYDYYQTRASATFSSTNLTDFIVRRRTAPCQPLSADKAHNQSPVTGNSTGYI
ncbi:hypothetical protein TNCV_100601 [Trichonephila clavipes]|nr:hypothetical protein TNCV_100601 [Trichonephila clavipes]